MEKSIERLGQDLAQANYCQEDAEDVRRSCRAPVEATVRAAVGGADAGKELRWTYRTGGFGTRFECVVGHHEVGRRFGFCIARRLGSRKRCRSCRTPKAGTCSLPTVLSLEEVGALIAAVRNARYQAVVMVLYGAGLLDHRSAGARGIGHR